MGEPATSGKPVADYTLLEIRDGRFYFDGMWQFLKIAKPLRNFGKEEPVHQLISDLVILKEKNYSAIEINCYWHHFDIDGDGQIDVSLDPLNQLIDSIYAKGMYPCLSVETYAVGGGQIPEGFWKKYPDAYCINHKGQRVTDTEYGFNHDVVSIYHEGYRQTVHSFISNLARGIDTKKILWFETTVEPQYMGAINICYSGHASAEYAKWREANNITDAGSAFPQSFPMPQSFVENATWNRFRAQFLGRWVSEDAAAYRAVAGEDAYVAVDYLDAVENTMMRRNGDPIEFLSSLENVNIIQVNWSWYFPSDSPNQKAYDRVYQVMNDRNRDWAVTEHMTFNGSDFVNYSDEKLQQILMNTLEQGTRFGWEFVNIGNSSGNPFSLYHDDWRPKRVMQAVDDNWDYWMGHVEKIESRSGY
ncbi:MAG: hypothetical protein P1P82_16590 [Bacteroidales bacterium]|nr:hypothetical protein [Bacteroidales bacterium]MDT8430720.1 hypothetical protein [Bacteroidales bacterium]